MTFTTGKYYGGGWPPGKPRGVVDPLLIGDLVQYMERYKKSAKSIAKSLGVADTTVGRWIAGKRNPSAEVAEKLRVMVSGNVKWIPKPTKRRPTHTTCPICFRERRRDRKHRCPK